MSDSVFFAPDNRTPEQRELAARFRRVEVRDDPTLWACQSCGCVVNDRELHASRCRE